LSAAFSQFFTWFIRSVADKPDLVVKVPNLTSTLLSYIAYPVTFVAASNANIRYVFVPFLGTLFFLILYGSPAIQMSHILCLRQLSNVYSCLCPAGQIISSEVYKFL